MTLRTLCSSREVAFQFLYCFIAASSLMSTGTTLGYSSIALPVLTSNVTSITLSENEMPLFASSPTISQILGSLASFVTMKQGRRFAIIIGTLVSALGWTVISFSYTTSLLFTGRILTGFSSGLCSSAGAVYIGEISTTDWRAVFTSTPSLFICIGILMVYLFGFLMQDNWKGVAIACIVIPTISGLSTILFLPESPIWLLTKNRKEDAKHSLQRIRGNSQQCSKFQEEFDSMSNYVNAQKKFEEDNGIYGDHHKESWMARLWRKIKHLLITWRLPEVWKPFFILTSYFFFQQFCGIYVIISYAVNIVVNFGVTIDPFFTVVLLGCIQVIFGVINIICSARIGRRTISIISGGGMAISLLILGLNTQMFRYESIEILPFVFIIIFVASGSFGFTVLPWAMIGELYPSEFVNFLGPVTTSLSGIFNFTAIQLYPITEKYDVIVTIYFFFIVSTIATVFMIFFLPETRGKTKAEIEAEFKNKFIVKVYVV